MFLLPWQPGKWSLGVSTIPGRDDFDREQVWMAGMKIATDLGLQTEVKDIFPWALSLAPVWCNGGINISLYTHTHTHTIPQNSIFIWGELYLYKTICLKITDNVTTIPALFSCLGLQFKRLISILFQLEGEGAQADRGPADLTAGGQTRQWGHARHCGAFHASSHWTLPATLAGKQELLPWSYKSEETELEWMCITFCSPQS